MIDFIYQKENVSFSTQKKVVSSAVSRHDHLSLSQNYSKWVPHSTETVRHRLACWVFLHEQTDDPKMNFKVKKTLDGVIIEVKRKKNSLFRFAKLVHPSFRIEHCTFYLLKNSPSKQTGASNTIQKIKKSIAC